MKFPVTLMLPKCVTHGPKNVTLDLDVVTEDPGGVTVKALGQGTQGV